MKYVSQPGACPFQQLCMFARLPTLRCKSREPVGVAILAGCDFARVCKGKVALHCWLYEAVTGITCLVWFSRRGPEQ